MRHLRFVSLMSLTAALIVGTAGRADASTLVTKVYDYQSTEHTFTVPQGVTAITIDAVGARGGGVNAGAGGEVKATVPVTPGEVLRMDIARSGGDPEDGGAGDVDGGDAYLDGAAFAGGGGGASAVRRAPYAVTDRIVVAGGGGGSTYQGAIPGGNGGRHATDGASGAWASFGRGGRSGSSGGAGGAAGDDDGCHCTSDGADGTTTGQGGDGGAAVVYQWGGAGGGAGQIGGGGGGGGNGGPGGGGGGGSSAVNVRAIGTPVFHDGVNGQHGMVTITYTDPFLFLPTTPLPADIPDGSGACGFAPTSGLDVNFDVSGLHGIVTLVEATFTFAPAHTRAGDISVSLESPHANTTLFGATGVTTIGGCGDDSDLAGPYTFSDAAPATPTWWTNAATASSTVPIAAGSYRASTPGGFGGGGANTLITPVFAGDDPNGTWTLHFLDAANGNTSKISQASLHVVTVDKADMTVGDSPDRLYVCGSSCKLTKLQIDNIGSRPVPAFSRRRRARAPLVRLYRSQSDLDNGIVWGSARITKGIPAHGTLMMDVKVATGPPPADFIAVVDPTLRIAEVYEDNNTRTVDLP